MAKITTVNAQVLEISTDRTQYKPYAYKIQPIGLFVELVIPADSIAHKDDDGTVTVTMDGFSLLLGDIATSIEGMHRKWEASQTGIRR